MKKWINNFLFLESGIKNLKDDYWFGLGILMDKVVCLFL